MNTGLSPGVNGSNIRLAERRGSVLFCNPVLHSSENPCDADRDFSQPKSGLVERMRVLLGEDTEIEGIGQSAAQDCRPSKN